MDKIKVTTKFNPDLIESKVEAISAEQIDMGPITNQIIRLQDEGIRKALIELGWTPPKEIKER